VLAGLVLSTNANSVASLSPGLHTPCATLGEEMLFTHILQHRDLPNAGGDPAGSDASPVAQISNLRSRPKGGSLPARLYTGYEPAARRQIR